VSCLIIIGIYIPTFQYRQELNHAYNDLIKNLKETENKYVTATPLERLDRVKLRDSYYRKFTDIDYAMVQVKDSMFLHVLSVYLSKQEQEGRWRMALPESVEKIKAHCTPANEVSNGCYHIPPLNYYIIKRKQTAPQRENAHLHLTLTPFTLWGKIKDKVQHKENGVEVSLLFDDIYPSFQEDDSSYYIYRDDSYIIGKQVAHIAIIE
jgi:hypothetical protein